MREMLKGLVDGGWMPVVSMTLFFLTFVMVSIRAMMLNKEDREYCASLPLDSADEAEQEG